MFEDVSQVVTYCYSLQHFVTAVGVQKLVLGICNKWQVVMFSMFFNALYLVLSYCVLHHSSLSLLGTCRGIPRIFPWGVCLHLKWKITVSIIVAYSSLASSPLSTEHIVLLSFESFFLSTMNKNRWVKVKFA
ncbi:unnamed protein product [Owenia fusiformis]|uniref:Uncharacterized protein n=1 Tax=Owenia fusiformis TaxID=6347 RepID=A0A8S4N6E5_OWEFU|nr:unnamed protein product [Owenia fusiformis]